MFWEISKYGNWKFENVEKTRAKKSTDPSDKLLEILNMNSVSNRMEWKFGNMGTISLKNTQ